MDSTKVIPIKFRRDERVGAREITPRRLAASRRALQRQRDKHPLFAEEIAAAQPTPEERISRIDQHFAEFWLNMRNFHAKCWREGRAILRSWPEPTRHAFIHHWNTEWSGPKTAVYFADKLRTYAIRNNLPHPELKETTRRNS